MTGFESKRKMAADKQEQKQDKDYIDGWNDALNEAAARIANVRGFGQATQDSFAVYINGLKK